MSKPRAKSAAGNYAASMLPSVPAAHKADHARGMSLSSTLDGIDELLTKSSNSGKLPKSLKLRAPGRPTSRTTLRKPPGLSSDQPKSSQDSLAYTPMSVEVPREPLRFSSTEDAAWPRNALAANSAKMRRRASTANLHSPPKSPSQKHGLRRRSRIASLINLNAPSPALTQTATADDAAIENPPAVIRLDDSDEDELQEVEEKARDACRTGDNARAASICIRGIQLYGEEVR